MQAGVTAAQLPSPYSRQNVKNQDLAKKEEDKQELLQRFRADLKRPTFERYYTEEELLAIFDYAGDEIDDYVRMEVLLLGVRLYPDSEELQSRRAIFYRDIDPEAFRDYMHDNPSKGDGIKELLRMTLADYDESDAEKALDDYLLTHSLSEDEEVIRFVQTAHEIGADDWLVRNLDRIKEKVEYLPSLLYEIAILSAESEPFDSIAADVLDELTEAEPYASEFWLLLASVHLRHGRFAEAMTAVDYALAINPDDVETLKAKFRICDESEDTSEAVKVLDKLREYLPDDPELALIKVLYMEDACSDDEIRDFIKTLSPAARSGKEMLANQIKFDVEGYEEYVVALLEGGETDKHFWTSMTFYCQMCSNPKARDTIMRLYEEMTGDAFDRTFYDFQKYLYGRNYEGVIECFEAASPESELKSGPLRLESYAIYMTMLLRTGRKEKARIVANEMLEKLRDADVGVSSVGVEEYGMLLFVKDVLRRLKSIRPTDWQRYDPMNVIPEPRK